MIRFKPKKNKIPMYDELKDCGLDEIDSLSKNELYSIRHYNIYYKSLKKKLDGFTTNCEKRAYLSQIKYKLNEANVHWLGSYVNAFQNLLVIFFALFVSKAEQVFNGIVSTWDSTIWLGVACLITFVLVFRGQKYVVKIEDNNDFYLNLISDMEKELKL